MTLHNQQIAPVTHILPLTGLRRARLLPVNGRVLVRASQDVTPTDIVAEGDLNPRHLLVPIGHLIKNARRGQARKMIERKVGERIQESDVLVSTGGLFKQVVRAPASGVILQITANHILIEAPGQPFQLLAGMSGRIAEIIPDRGAILEASGTLIQGVWGNGLVGAGMLLIKIKSPDDELTSSMLNMNMRGEVTFGGYVREEKVLKYAAEVSMGGLILGSMHASLIPLAKRLKLPVILLEGFGHIPVNSAAFKILTTNEKRDVAINAIDWKPLSGDRPEIIISLPAKGEIGPETDVFRPGHTVRIVTPPYAGRIGKLVGILSEQVRLPSGLRARAAIVTLENGEGDVTIPLANMDVIE
jgi:hypothetical protein